MLEALLGIIVREREVAGASIKQTTMTTIEKYEQALPSKYCRNKYSQIWAYACTWESKLLKIAGGDPTGKIQLFGEKIHKWPGRLKVDGRLLRDQAMTKCMI